MENLSNIKIQEKSGLTFKPRYQRKSEPKDYNTTIYLNEKTMIYYFGNVMDGMKKVKKIHNMTYNNLYIILTLMGWKVINRNGCFSFHSDSINEQTGLPIKCDIDEEAIKGYPNDIIALKRLLRKTNKYHLVVISRVSGGADERFIIMPR